MTAEQVRRLRAEAFEQAAARRQERVQRLHDAIFDLMDHDGEYFTSHLLVAIGTLVGRPPPGAWHERPLSNPLAEPGKP